MSQEESFVSYKFPHLYQNFNYSVIENAGNEIVQVHLGPLSPPITDQTEYNVVAGYLRDDKRGQLF